MNPMRALHGCYDAVFPPVTTRLCREMQRSVYRYVWRVSAAQQIRLCVLTLLVFPLEMAPLELQRLIVNEAIESGALRLLALYGALYVAVLLAHGALKYALRLYQSRVGEGVIRVLRMRVASEPAGTVSTSEGARVSMLAAEAEQVGGFVGEAVSFPLLQAGILLTVMGYMLWLEPLMAGVALLFVAPMAVVLPRIQAVINRHVARRTELLRELGDATAGDDDRDAESVERFNARIERIYETRVRIFVMKYLLKALQNLLSGLGPLSILLVGGWMVIEGRTEVGTIVAFLSGFERLTSPVRELLNFYRRLSQLRIQYRLLSREVAGEG